MARCSTASWKSSSSVASLACTQSGLRQGCGPHSAAVDQSKNQTINAQPPVIRVKVATTRRHFPGSTARPCIVALPNQIISLAHPGDLYDQQAHSPLERCNRFRTRRAASKDRNDARNLGTAGCGFHDLPLQGMGTAFPRIPVQTLSGCSRRAECQVTCKIVGEENVSIFQYNGRQMSGLLFSVQVKLYRAFVCRIQSACTAQPFSAHRPASNLKPDVTLEK
ncbi:hypothetical protein IQ06DRAFT_300147 [Phaeosphaeriaceae sp. SRC1lsM3a]|nr:hypothetical protein IQ06DRAFT_300147 [Stagonospora sp. SRC1lsM3a]